MKNHKHFITFEIDDSVPEWDEIGFQALFAGMAGMLLSVLLYAIVFYA